MSEYFGLKVGDKVKVIGQDIFGIVLVIHKDTNEVVIRDLDSEDNDVLVYRPSELEEVNDE